MNTRNKPCRCGSGKKTKKCCEAPKPSNRILCDSCELYGDPGKNGLCLPCYRKTDSGKREAAEAAINFKAKVSILYGIASMFDRSA